MKFAVRNLILSLLISMTFVGSASAQYMKLVSDNPTDNTKMRASGTTVLTFMLDSNHDRNGSVQTCNSHTAALGCGTATTNPLDVGSFTLTLTAVGGTVTWGAFTTAGATTSATYADLNGGVPIQSSTQTEIDFGRASGFDTPGLYTMGSIPVTPTSGNPGIVISFGPQPVNVSGFGTGFGTECDASNFPNTYVLGNPADLCGSFGDFGDADGVGAAATSNRPPVLAQPANVTVNEGATANNPLSATDPDGNPLTFAKVSGPTYATVTTTTPGTGTATGNVALAPGFSDAGTATVSVNVTDTGGASDGKSFLVTVNNVNRPPTLSQPTAMAVAENATADQTLTGSDPDADPLTFSKVAGPTYLTVTTTDATHGNAHLAPGFSDAGSAGATVRASDGTLTDDKSFTITVANTNRAPVLAQPTNMSVAQGATSDQTITATDADGQALTFAKVTGPTFMTVTTTTPGTGTATGNIHLAAGAAETVGTSSASVSATDGSLTDTKSLTVTVTAGANHPPVLAQPANVTVNEGATANNPLSATDQDGNALTFSKISGPTYATVTTTTPGTGTATGNVALAPGFSDSGTATVSVSVSDGSASDGKSFTVTVNNVNRPPTLTQPSNMSVARGGTADQALTGSDPDGDALTFSLVSGPTFASVTTTNATTGNIHLAAGVAEPLGTSSATVRASDGSLNDDKSLTVTVTAGANQPPVLAQPADMTVNEGATADQVITATDPDGNPLTFSKVSGPTFLTVSTTSPGTGSAMGNIHLGPGFADAGTYGATVRASDGTANSDKSLAITVNNVNRAPTLNPIANMTATEGATADQSISGSDPDGDPLTFAKVTGPIFVMITTSTATTGNVHVAPLTGDSGASPYTVQASASDGTAQATRIFSVTVRPANRAPVLAQPSDMTVNEGATADQTLNATDPDGDAVTFSLLSGPTYAAVTTTSPGTGTATGNIHLAPGFSDAGTAAATVRASDGSLTDDKSLTITVNNVNRPPTLIQPTNMSVAQGATADQVLMASDPDGDALTFSLVTGPTFASVTTTNATTGNIHLAAGVAEPVGTSSATVRASDGALNNDKSLTITVTSTQQNHAPVLAQPNNMTVDEGATADQVLTATDQDGDALSFTKVGGPTFLTVGTVTSTTGNAHLAPAFADAGTYNATVRASDGSLSDDKSFSITVNNVNRAPVANAGGPYSGIVGIPVAFDGSASSDPDGNALTYSWDFDSSDGITEDATGPTPSHTYGAPGTFTVTLTVTDNDPVPLSNTATTTATISSSNGFPATASVSGGDRVIRLNSAKPFWCVSLEPVNRSFQVTDIIPSSVLATFNGTSIHAISRTRVVDGVFEVCFTKDQLRILFASLSSGRRTVTIAITGDLNGGGTFIASLDVVVVKGGGAGSLAKDDEGNGQDAFAYASPNPLNPSTTISFELSRPGTVRLNVYDVSGRLVKALANEFMGVGPHEVGWDGTSRQGARVASGVYFYVLQTPELTVKSHLVVAK